jgi:hypothetical protein
MKKLLPLIMLLFLTSCYITKEVVLDPEGVPSGVERVVVEGPGGDMVSVGVEVIERFAPLLPEPWQSIVLAIVTGFTFGTAGWIFRGRRKTVEGTPTNLP